jgi:metal-dependent hydrolase (beta-lactamase superfamily II)
LYVKITVLYHNKRFNERIIKYRGSSCPVKGADIPGVLFDAGESDSIFLHTMAVPGVPLSGKWMQQYMYRKTG